MRWMYSWSISTEGFSQAGKWQCWDEGKYGGYKLAKSEETTSKKGHIPNCIAKTGSQKDDLYRPHKRPKEYGGYLLIQLSKTSMTSGWVAGWVTDMFHVPSRHAGMQDSQYQVLPVTQ